MASPGDDAPRVIYIEAMRALDTYFSASDGHLIERYQRACDLGLDESEEEFMANAQTLAGSADPDGTHLNDDLLGHVADHWLPGGQSWFSDPSARLVLSRAFHNAFRVGAATGLPLNTTVLAADVGEVSANVIRGATSLNILIVVPGAQIPDEVGAGTFVVRTPLVWSDTSPSVLHFTSATAELDVPEGALIEDYR